MTDGEILSIDIGADRIDMYYKAVVRKLEESADYRVLRRLKELVPSRIDPVTPVFRGLYVDCETTGLDMKKDEVIELCAWPFKFSRDGLITSFSDPLCWYQQPSQPIKPEITKLTRIDDATVFGQSIDIVRLEQTLLETDLVVAHNAEFDRKMLERLSIASTFEKLPWACSQSQAPWKENGMSGSRLGYLMMEMGLFHDAHGAMPDCMAGLRALQHAFADGKTALYHLLEATRAVTWHVWLIGAGFDERRNEALKERGYWWNDGKDGRPKAWHRTVPDVDVEAEKAWLADRWGLRSPRLDRVTAYERFSVRG